MCDFDGIAADIPRELEAEQRTKHRNKNGARVSVVKLPDSSF